MESDQKEVGAANLANNDNDYDNSISNYMQ